MGFFLHWAVLAGYWQGLPKDVGDAEIVPLLRGEWTGTKFLLERYDGKLLSEAFTEEGAKVVEKYYPRYCALYQEVIEQCGYKEYHVPDTLPVFERMLEAINADRQSHTDKPWWRFW